MAIITKILQESWNILCLSAPYMLFGFFIAGLLKAFIPDDFIARNLGMENRRNLFKAALFGVPIPLCSCGVLPAAAGLRQQGASKGATTAFLISTPETGVDSISVTWALLDPLMAVIRPFSAFITALVTGQLVRVLDPDQRQPAGQPPATEASCCSSAPAASGCGCSSSVPSAGQPGCFERLKKGMGFAFGDLFGDIAGWFLFGVVLAGLITVFLSPALVDNWLGNHLVAMLVMLVVGMPLYVCATASTPIAAALVLKGLNPGAALVFLLAGPATNAAAIAVISRILGRKATLIYVVGIVISSLVLGFVVDGIYGATDLTAGWQIGTEDAGHGMTGTISALLLMVLMLIKKLKKKENCCSGTSCECH